MSADTKVLVRAAEIEAMAEGSFQHPLNPRSEIHLKSLSQVAGMKRVGVHVGRIPPGKESFAYHSHHFEEEFLYILTGRGMADIDGRRSRSGPATSSASRRRRWRTTCAIRSTRTWST